MLDVYVHILRHVSQIVNTGLVMLAHIVKIDWCNQSLNQLKIVTTHKMFKSHNSLQFALLAEKTCQLINHPQNTQFEQRKPIMLIMMHQRSKIQIYS